MQFFEAIYLITTFLLLIAISFLGNKRLQIIFFRISVIFLIVHFLLEIARWQIGFTYLLWIVLALLILKQSRTYLVFRIIGFTIGLLIISTSVFYAIEMPIIKLPEPAGSFKVGNSSFIITDNSREETHSIEHNDKRELFVEVWYPADLEGIQVPSEKKLWEELYIGDLDRVSFFMNYLKGISTHSFQDVPADQKHGPYPVILFNHAMQMFTSQNTLLMEHLASNGYVVVSIAHPYESLRVNLGERTVLPPFITSREKFNEAMVWIEKSSNPIEVAKDSMTNVQEREERGKIMLNAIKNSEMNLVVSEWVKDNTFVLDILTSDNDYIFNEILDTTRIGVMGMSIGGATAGEMCKIDRRVKAGINVDGLQYGMNNHIGLEVPFMMMYSDDGAGVNDFLYVDSNSEYHELHFRNTRHADFTDMVLIWPIMKIAGQSGSIPPKQMIPLTNKKILDFWEYVFKNASNPYESSPDIVYSFKPKE